jgi:uncharacterized protein (TIGR03437 family)
MRKLFSFLFIATALAINTGKTESFVFSTTSGGVMIHWNLIDSPSPIVQNGRVVYNLNPAGSDDVPFAQVEAAITSSFKTWEDLTTCSIAFTRGPNRTETGAKNDGIFQIYWQENSTVDDGLDISGALAVTRLFTYMGNGRDGEIADASLVFNGKEVHWATDGNPSRIDIAEVATHEIGHSIGLSHTPVAAATMFPRTGEGFTRGRTLHSDDQIPASILYPANNFLAQTGTLRGRVRDTGGGAIFGADVVVTDANGNVIATMLTQRDGTYRLQGLPPGAHTVFVGPIDPPGGLFFSPDDLHGYDDAQTNFLTSNDQAVTITAGSETVLDVTVTRATPALRAQLVYQPATGGFTNLGALVQPGQSVTIGLAGTGLPTSGNPLSVSGGGITIQRTRFGTLNSGSKAVVADVVIAANAVPGARNLIVTSNGQRSIIVGGLEIAGTSAPPQPLSIVSAANFSARVAAESIVAAFGSSLATSTLTAVGKPLPTLLGGTGVRVRDSQGNERPAPLFFVSPKQVNYQIPPGTAFGPALVTITNIQGQVSTGNAQIEPVAPGLFTVTGTGSGPAAAVALRVKANGAQSFESVFRFDNASNKFVTIPLDLGVAAGDQVFLILYGTGFRFRSSLAAVTVSAGGINQQVTYAGAQGSLVGLDQLNVRLSGLAGRGEVDVNATADGRVSNAVRVNIK